MPRSTPCTRPVVPVWMLLMLLSALLMLPAPASARPGGAAEPVVVVPGLGENCVDKRVDDAANPVLAGLVSQGLTAAIAASHGAAEPVPETWVHGWRFSACHRTLSILAQQLDHYLAKVQAQHGGGPVDLVSFSFGGAIIRYCLTNPRGATPRCAARVDDWVGIVNATNGTTKADTKTCLTAGLVGLWSICDALSRTSTEIRRMNRRGVSTAAVEYTMVWTPEDDFLLPSGTSKLPGARNVALHSALGRVTHLGSWLGPCTTTQYWVGVELADLAAHTAADASVDCNAMPAGVLPGPPPPAPTTPAATTPAPGNPGAPSATEGTTAPSGNASLMQALVG